jgi:hypothetical protein
MGSTRSHGIVSPDGYFTVGAHDDRPDLVDQVCFLMYEVRVMV